jgi:hypothetical protein
MGRAGNAHQHARTWRMVVALLVVVVVAAGGGGAAKALNDRSGGNHAGHGRPAATTTSGATVAASATSKLHKPRHTTTTTTSPSTTSLNRPGIRLCWRIQVAGRGWASRASREVQPPVVATPVSQASTRTRLMASAVSTCCRWVLARPR